MQLQALLVTRKDIFSGLSQLLATESHLKMMEENFLFTLKALFALKKFFKMCDITTWLTDNYNIHVAQYLKK